MDAAAEPRNDRRCAPLAPPGIVEPGLALLAPALRAGELPLPDYLHRLEHHFIAHEQLLRAFLPEECRFQRLRHQAAELVARHPQPAERPPLFGVPIGVKDVFRVAGFPTSAGSKLPPELFAGEEATCVTALRRAGALVLGKTVSTEFAYFAPGPTRNPHDPEHTPGGSSSGSAAAVAAGLCPLALGTQTIGSLIRPAAYCGVVGYKPSCGRIPTSGLIPLAPSLDHVGFFTPDVAGARLAASVLLDSFRLKPPATTATPPGRPRLAVPVGPFLERTSELGRRHFSATVARLRERGFEVVEVPAFAEIDELERQHRLIVAAEAAQVHAAWFERYRELYAPQSVELIERGGAVTATELEVALAGRERLRGELATQLVRAGADLWVSPSAQGPAPRGLGATGDPIMNLPWTYAGMPVLGLPASCTDSGLPLGLQVAGGFGEDERLIDWGGTIEAALTPHVATGGSEP